MILHLQPWIPAIEERLIFLLMMKDISEMGVAQNYTN